MPNVTQVSTETRKPFYATVGLGQLAVESARTQAKTVPAEIAKLQDQALDQAKTIPTIVTSLSGKVSALPTQVKTQYDTYSSKYSAKAQEVYGDLVARGEKLVGSVRRQKSTKDAEASVKQAQQSAKGTVTTTKKAVKATEKAAADAADKV